MAPLRIVINGCAGHMGRRLCALAVEDPDLQLVGVIDPSQTGTPLSQIVPSTAGKTALFATSTYECLADADVMIDFSVPAGTVAAVEAAINAKCPVVIGTTGLNETQKTAVENASRSVPIIHAMNYSLGVNVLCKVVGDVAKALGQDFNIEVVEAHHNRKIDAPSGTAFALADSVLKATGRTRADLVYGRHGVGEKRKPNQVGMHSLRMGGVVGDHTVHYGSNFERLELTHRAEDRDVFAYGALRAAKWLSKMETPRMYGMNEVLFGENEKEE